MKSHEIKFSFIHNQFNYELPLLGVDLDFISKRKAEIQDCMQQLATRTSQINIASAQGVADFEIASKLVKYYWYAMCTVKHKESALMGYNAELTEEQKESHEVYMREQYKEKTR